MPIASIVKTYDKGVETLLHPSGVKTLYTTEYLEARKVNMQDSLTRVQDMINSLTIRINAAKATI